MGESVKQRAQRRQRRRDQERMDALRDREALADAIELAVTHASVDRSTSGRWALVYDPAPDGFDSALDALRAVARSAGWEPGDETVHLWLDVLAALMDRRYAVAVSQADTVQDPRAPAGTLRYTTLEALERDGWGDG